MAIPRELRLNDGTFQVTQFPRILLLGTALVACSSGCSSTTVDNTGSGSSGTTVSGAGGAVSGAGGTVSGAGGTVSGAGGTVSGAGGTGNTAGTGVGGDTGVSGAGGSTGGVGGTNGGPDAAGVTDAPPDGPPDFGPNVFVFDPSMPMDTIQSRIDAVAMQQQTSEFGTARYAYFFKPGQYSLDVRVGYYMQVLGLGQSPDDVTITGAVRAKADHRANGNATTNFWRGAENVAVVPRLDGNVAIWAVSQGTFLRRMHIQGPLRLWEVACTTAPCTAYSSGGFMANSKIDGQVTSGTQQQFFSRNTDWASWIGVVWNMVFVGAQRPPPGAWPTVAYTVVANTPLIREKPFLFIDPSGNYFVSAPGLKSNSLGIDWATGAATEGVVSIDRFHLARPDRDTAATINAALNQGRNLILTPGVYHLDDTLRVSRPGTIILGLGIPTLVPTQGIPLMAVADVDGVQIGGIQFDAGPTDSSTLLQIGEPGSAQNHSQNPTFLYDVFCRVGGATVGTVSSCVTINSNNVVGDNLWLWRADHGAGAMWTVNKSKNGLIVNGNDVIVHGLFVEHFQEFQTLWNGNGGHVYFYQSELPYDPPTQADWQHDGVNGFAAYKVADTVTSHEARGLGIYSNLRNPVIAENAIETSIAPNVMLNHMITVWLNGSAGSSITHVINGMGNAVTQTIRESRTPN